MDLEYSVKQLDVEIAQTEVRLTEKKKERAQNYAALDEAAKKRIDAAIKEAAKQKG
jgi:hypothetical protein